MSNPNTPTILISGLSIAGPTLAYWLNRYGFQVTLVERAPSLRKGGYAIDIRGTAIQVIERMGLLDQVRAADTAMQGMTMVNRDGTPLYKMNDASMGNQKGIDIEIMRDHLSQILYDAGKDAYEVLWDDSITGLKEIETGVEVTFQHASPRTFDLVIGADGLHSNVRRLIFGDEAQFLTYLGCYISIFTLDNYLSLDHQQLVYNALGTMTSIYSSRHNQEAKALFIFKSDQLQYDRYDTTAQKKLLANAFASKQEWEISRLLDAMENATDFYFDSISQIHMDQWSKGRVVLVGDAAFGPSPASGQGTSLALVGAYVLAGEIYAAQGDYAAAFACYEHNMREFVQKNQKIALLAVNNIVETSVFQIWIRNLVVKVPGLMRMMYKQVEKMIAKTANAIKLKDYCENRHKLRT